VAKAQVGLYVVSTAANFFLWRQLVSMARPSRSATGAVAGAGDDLSQEGLTACEITRILLGYRIS
jgi:hypothetical protein